MHNHKKITSHLVLIERYITAVAVIWTIVVAASFTFEIVRVKQETLNSFLWRPGLAGMKGS